MTMKSLFSELKKLVLAAEAEDGAAIELAAGEPKVIEIAKSGTVFAKKGGEITLTPEHLSGFAARFDAGGFHKVKIGHTRIDTDTPNYGDITALAYDEKADRLRATVVPKPALIRKNQEEGFTRVSMELDGSRDKLGEAVFSHLSFLGAHPPAIEGLEEVAFAADRGDVPVLVFAAGTTEEKKPDGGVLDTRDYLPTEKGKGDNTPEEIAMSEENKKVADLEAQGEKSKIELANAKARLERFEKQATDTAVHAAKAFVTANEKRIPMLARKAGFEPGLAALLAQEAVTENVAAIEFAAAGEDGKAVTKKLTPSEFIMAMFAALPEQTTKDEESEKATKGLDIDELEHGKVVSLAGRNPRIKFAASAFDEKVRAYMASEKAKDPTSKLTYTQASEIVGASEASK